MTCTKSKVVIYFLVLTLSFILLLLLTSVAVYLAQPPRLVTRKEDCRCENLKESKYRIVNGTKGRELEEGLPWIGFLFVKGKNEKGDLVELITCTLTIIGRHWALTAYHCIQKREVRRYMYIGAGLDHNPTKILKEPRNVRKVEKFYKPPTPESYLDVRDWSEQELENYFENYLKNLTNLPEDEQKKISLDFFFNMFKYDIALLEVLEAWEFSEATRIQPACLMNFERDHFEDTFLAAGYGDKEIWYEEEGSGKSNESDPGLGELTMTRLQLTNLTRHYFGLNNSFSNVCSGDSGGPLHYFVPPVLYVVGVASYVLTLKDSNNNTFNCVPGQTALFVSVYNHLSWIRSITGGDLCDIDARNRTEENEPGSTMAE